MKAEKGKTYLVDWGQAITEFEILEETEKAVRGRGTSGGKYEGNGSWHKREEIEAKIVDELKRS